MKSLLFCQKFFSLEFSIAVCYFDNALKIKYRWQIKKRQQTLKRNTNKKPKNVVTRVPGSNVLLCRER